MLDKNNIGPGSVVKVKTWENTVVIGTVDDVDYEGKNGMATFGYVMDNGEGRWAYFNQIADVIAL